MRQTITSFLSALRAEFLLLLKDLQNLFPQSSSQKTLKEVTVTQNSTLDNHEFAQFIERLRTFGHRQAYQQLVDTAQANFKPMSTQDWLNLFALVDTDIRRGSPGHDFGHTRRDALDTFALATDKNVLTYQPAEIQAGILVLLHDYGVSFVPRYKDFETLFGHAEEGAWRVYRRLHGLIEENLLLLVCYGIAAHTHYTKDMPCKDGSIRKPWWYELFEADGKKYGWAVLACRFGDRLDTNGTTLLLRHLLANADAVESGGQDLTGKTFYDINQDSIRIMITPQKAMLDLPDGKKAPTTLQHVLNFSSSNFGTSVYSRDDHLFVTMERLMGYKVAQAMSLTTLTRPATPWEKAKISLGFNRPLADLKKLLFRASRAPRFNDAWEVLVQAFSKLSANDLAIWARIIVYLNGSYDMWLEILKTTIVDNNNEFTAPILPLLDDLIAEIS